MSFYKSTVYPIVTNIFQKCLICIVGKGVTAEVHSMEVVKPVTDHVKRGTETVEVESSQPYEEHTKDCKSPQTMISPDGMKCSSFQTSQASPLNLSPAQNGSLAKLLANSHPTPLHNSRLALKVPSLPVSPYSQSPVSYQASPPPGTTAVKPESYSALRSLLQGSARVNLTSEFEEKIAADHNGMNDDDKYKGKPHDCPECGKSFLYRSSYKRHMKIHQGVFTHHCNTCERKFARREHFVRHKCTPVKPGDHRHVEDWGGLTNSPLKMEEVWRIGVPSPVGYISKWQDHIDTGSESSGQGSPDYYGESRRKKSAPRKVLPEVEAHNESYFSDLDESIYDSVGIKTENGALDFSMKSKKQTKEIVSENGSLDLSIKSAVKILSEKQPSVVSDDCAVKILPSLVAENVHHNLYESPPVGFRIGDLIENAVTKYHSADTQQYMSPIKAEERAEFLANNRPQVLSPPRNDACETDQDGTSSGKPDPSDATGSDANFLSTNTGTYQITTEEVDSDSPMTEVGTPNKVIKVVKQGNYLKLKKEAQLIDGELRFVCPHCNKVFHRSSNFSRHMRIHRGVFSYICSACNRGFYRKEHFDKHKCYRKAMATTWDRKTRVDMDQEVIENGDKENLVDCPGKGEERDMGRSEGEGHLREYQNEPVYPLCEPDNVLATVEQKHDRLYSDPVCASDEEPNLVIDE